MAKLHKKAEVLEHLDELLEKNELATALITIEQGFIEVFSKQAGREFGLEVNKLDGYHEKITVPELYKLLKDKQLEEKVTEVVQKQKQEAQLEVCKEIKKTVANNRAIIDFHKCLIAKTNFRTLFQEYPDHTQELFREYVLYKLGKHTEEKEEFRIYDEYLEYGGLSKEKTAVPIELWEAFSKAM